MSKLNITRGMKTVKSVITANSPVLLLGASIAGVVATGVLSAKAGYKARGIVDEEKARRGDEAVKGEVFETYVAEKEARDKAGVLTTQEKVSLTWLCYVPAAISGVSTIASCTGIHLIHSKRNAMLAGLYAVTAGKLDDYKDQAEELLGAKKSQQLTDSMAQKTVDEGGPLVNNQIVLNEGGTELCHDDMTGRYFLSNMNLIDGAVNEVNAMLIDEGEIDLNIFYDRLGLEPVPFGDDFGWTKAKTKKVGVSYGNVTSPDGRPAISITFRPAPKPQSSR